MRKFALIAMLAIVGAMVPMTTASSQPTPGSLDGVGTLMVINPGTAVPPVDLWIEIESGEWQKFEINSPAQEEIQVPDGNRNFQLCVRGAFGGTTDQTCAQPVGGPTPLGTPGTVNVDENDIINFLILPIALGGSPTAAIINQNDTEATETDKAKFTIFNASTADFDACIDSLHVIDLPAFVPGGTTAQAQTAEFDAKDGETRRLTLYSPFLGTAPFAGTCVENGTTSDLGFPPGSNTVLSIPDALLPACGSACGYQIFPGEEPPGSNNNVDEFCAVVLEAANITPWLQDLFAEVEVGNPDTYPSPEKVEKVITRIAELLEKGNQTAPADIIDAWLTATAAFVETGRLAAVDYDIGELTQDQLRDLVSLIDTPQEDDEETAAAVAALTAWVPVNCFGAVETEPSFTG
jgi:hypothetical protein